MGGSDSILYQASLYLSLLLYIPYEKYTNNPKTSIIISPPRAGIPRDAIMNISTQEATRGSIGTHGHMKISFFIRRETDVITIVSVPLSSASFRFSFDGVVVPDYGLDTMSWYNLITSDADTIFENPSACLIQLL